MVVRGRHVCLVVWLGACGGGRAAPDGSAPDASRNADARAADARALDAAAPDATPADAHVPCDPGAFTAGVSTLAGCDTAGREDGARGVARFANPVNVAAGPDGDLYVADFDNDRLRAIAADGTTRTVLAQADLHRPFGLAFASDGTLFVTTDDDDLGGHGPQTGTVWRVDLAAGTATVVVRDVGRPRGLVALPAPDGRLVMSDYLHDTIRLLDPTSGAMTVLAGAVDQPGWVDAVGAAARFSKPYGLALLPDGTIAVADYGNQRLRDVALDGTVTTIAGSGATGADDGPAATATFSSPQDVAVDAAGVLLVADTGNFVVRRLAGGAVDTVVGAGVAGWLDSDTLRGAQLYGLEGLDVAADGHTLWIADGTRGEDVPYRRVRVAALP